MKQRSQNPWFIWGIAGIFYFYEYILRVSPQVVTHELMGQYNLDSTSFGLMSAFYYFAYVPLQMPCGYILDRLGVRNVITGSSLLCAVGAIIFTYTDTLYIAYLGRFLMGVGSACAYVGSMKVGTDWFESTKFPLIAGLTLMMGQIGASSGTHPFAALVYYFSYATAMNVLITFGFMLAFISYFLIPQKIQESERQESVWTSLVTVVSSPLNWVLGIYGLFMYVGISGFSELWAVMFFIKKMNISCHIAATQPILFFIGVAVGSPIISNFAKKVNLPYLSMACLGLLGSVFFYFILYCDVGLTFLGISLFIMGSLCGGHVLCFVVAKENTKNHLSGTALGFINTVVMTSGLVFQPLIGFMLDQYWNGTIDDKGIRVYSLENFEYALSCVLFCYLSAFLLIAFYFRKNIKKEIQKFI